MAYPHRAMQIRPGPSLLQAISKAAEPRPTPFADRLADLEQAKGAIAPATAARSAARGEEVRPAAAMQPDAVASSQPAASRQPAAPPRRGSIVDIVV